MSEKNDVFEVGKGLYEFNKFFEFPEDKRDRVLLGLKRAAEIIVDPPKVGRSWASLESVVWVSYDFAKSIDPQYKIWYEKDNSYVVNPETEHLLIDFYEMIRGKTKEQISEAVKMIESKILKPQKIEIPINQ